MDNASSQGVVESQKENADRISGQQHLSASLPGSNISQPPENKVQEEDPVASGGAGGSAGQQEGELRKTEGANEQASSMATHSRREEQPSMIRSSIQQEADGEDLYIRSAKGGDDGFEPAAQSGVSPLQSKRSSQIRSNKPSQKRSSQITGSNRTKRNQSISMSERNSRPSGDQMPRIGSDVEQVEADSLPTSVVQAGDENSFGRFDPQSQLSNKHLPDSFQGQSMETDQFLAGSTVVAEEPELPVSKASLPSERSKTDQAWLPRVRTRRSLHKEKHESMNVILEEDQSRPPAIVRVSPRISRFVREYQELNIKKHDILRARFQQKPLDVKPENLRMMSLKPTDLKTLSIYLKKPSAPREFSISRYAQQKNSGGFSVERTLEPIQTRTNSVFQDTVGTIGHEANQTSQAGTNPFSKSSLPPVFHSRRRSEFDKSLSTQQQPFTSTLNSTGRFDYMQPKKKSKYPPKQAEGDQSKMMLFQKKEERSKPSPYQHPGSPGSRLNHGVSSTSIGKKGMKTSDSGLMRKKNNDDLEQLMSKSPTKRESPKMLPLIGSEEEAGGGAKPILKRPKLQDPLVHASPFTSPHRTLQNPPSQLSLAHSQNSSKEPSRHLQGNQSQNSLEMAKYQQSPYAQKAIAGAAKKKKKQVKIAAPPQAVAEAEAQDEEPATHQARVQQVALVIGQQPTAMSKDTQNISSPDHFSMGTHTIKDTVLGLHEVEKESIQQQQQQPSKSMIDRHLTDFKQREEEDATSPGMIGRSNDESVERNKELDTHSSKGDLSKYRGMSHAQSQKELDMNNQLITYLQKGSLRDDRSPLNESSQRHSRKEVRIEDSPMKVGTNFNISPQNQSNYSPSFSHLSAKNIETTRGSIRPRGLSTRIDKAPSQKEEVLINRLYFIKKPNDKAVQMAQKKMELELPPSREEEPQIPSHQIYEQPIKKPVLNPKASKTKLLIASPSQAVVPEAAADEGGNTSPEEQEQPPELPPPKESQSIDVLKKLYKQNRVNRITIRQGPPRQPVDPNPTKTQQEFQIRKKQHEARNRILIQKREERLQQKQAQDQAAKEAAEKKEKQQKALAIKRYHAVIQKSHELAGGHRGSKPTLPQTDRVFLHKNLKGAGRAQSKPRGRSKILIGEDKFEEAHRKEIQEQKAKFEGASVKSFKFSSISREEELTEGEKEADVEEQKLELVQEEQSPKFQLEEEKVQVETDQGATPKPSTLQTPAGSIPGEGQPVASTQGQDPVAAGTPHSKTPGKSSSVKPSPLVSGKNSMVGSQPEISIIEGGGDSQAAVAVDGATPEGSLPKKASTVGQESQAKGTPASSGAQGAPEGSVAKTPAGTTPAGATPGEQVNRHPSDLPEGEGPPLVSGEGAPVEG